MISVDLDKRRFLKRTLQAGLLCTLPSPLQAALLPGEAQAPRKLAFYNIHTREFVETYYYDRGDYLPSGLARINRVLRDHRTGEVTPIDLKLLDTLYLIRCKLGDCGTFSVISGYRSPATNAMLRRVTSGVAKNSYHMQGKAIDIRLRGCPTPKLRDVCIQARAGGVGYYPKSNFVHMDVGPVRCW
ncbi:MAG: DUF882 domain-containing protein [Desulfosarcinaceae bacterium]|nr:DUF882 domain-containing protein [Desulfosarcinaceae bacterium]